MELEKIATELAQKAVAARHSDNRLKPGEYPEWAAEFRKLAQEHYADLAMTKQAEGETPAAPAPEAPPPPAATGSYNPYNMYDNAVTPGGFMANPIVRNALVTGGLGAGVGALGSLASNLFSRKRKKRYLSDALSAGLLGGLAGGVGGAGYTALTDGKANTDLSSRVLGGLGIDTTPAANLNPAAIGERDRVNAAGQTLNSNQAALQKGLYGAAALNVLRAPVGSTLAGTYSGSRRTTADTKQMLSNAEQRLSSFRDSLRDASKKGTPKGNRQAIFNDFMQQHNLMPDANTGVISIKDPRYLAAALQDLETLNKRLDPRTGKALSGTIDINKLRQEVMGVQGASSGPGVIQSFKNPELAAQRLSGTDAGKTLASLYGKPAPHLVSLANNPAAARSRAITSYRSGFKGPSKGQMIASLGMAGGAHFGMPFFAKNPEARAQEMGAFLDNLRSSVASSAKNPLPPAEVARRQAVIDAARQSLDSSATTKEITQLFNQLGNAGVFEGAGAGK